MFLQDKEVLEAQQKAIEANPHMKPVAYNIDEGGTRARQIIARAIKAQRKRPGTEGAPQ